jgi:RNA polymerase sigma-70 factor, ECF subfamily
VRRSPQLRRAGPSSPGEEGAGAAADGARPVGPGAFERVVLPHADGLYVVAARLCGNPDDAEDLVQETLLKAWRAFGGFEPGTDCRAWLFVILKNTYLNHRRDRQRAALLAAAWGRRGAPRLAGPPSLTGDPEGELCRRRLSTALERALARLPPPFREAVVLADVRGLSYREIAAATRRPLGTVMSRLWRGRRLLRDALRPPTPFGEYGVRPPG